MIISILLTASFFLLTEPTIIHLRIVGSLGAIMLRILSAIYCIKH